jgi:hypothetical protein
MQVLSCYAQSGLRSEEECGDGTKEIGLIAMRELSFVEGLIAK